MINFSLCVRNVKSFKEYYQLSETLKEYDLIKYVFEDGVYLDAGKEAVFRSWEPQTWAANEGQLIIISEKYPHMSFELTCTSAEGELNSYRMYFKDGQTEFCCGDIVYEAPRKIPWEDLVVF